MDTQSLKIVLLVHAQQSLAGAARTLGLDPSSVSRTVASVEAELGVRLFQRSTRRLVTTEEGLVYLNRIAPVIEELDSAREDAMHRKRRPIGNLRMTASVAYASEVLVPLLPGFRDQYPDISLEIVSSDQQLDLVENNLDLAIRLAPALSGDVISTRLCATRYRVVCAPDFPSTQTDRRDPETLSGGPCLRYALPEVANIWRFRNAARPESTVEVTGAIALSNPLSLRAAARSGMGFAMLADWLIAEDVRAGCLIDAFPDHDCALNSFDTAVWALFPSRSHVPRKVRVMVDYLKSALRRND